MYRTNEAELVSAVLERKLAGDADGAIDAAIRLWLSPEERAADAGEPDEAHDEVWRALTEMGVTARASEAAVIILRDGEKLRFQAFIDIGESVPDPGTNAELAKLALDHRWGADYVVASLMRLVEASREPIAVQFVRTNFDALASPLETWIAIAALLTTTSAGNVGFLATWFGKRDTFTGVPIWILEAFAAVHWEPTVAGVERATLLARRALDECTRDDTSGYFHGLVAIDDLRHARDEAFATRMSAHLAELTRLATLAETGGLDHPAVRYLNRIKHKRSITLEDITWEPVGDSAFGTVGVAIKAVTHPRRPPNAKEGVLLGDLLRLPVRMALVLPLFVALHELRRGAPEVLSLCADLRRTRPSDQPWLMPAWDRMVKQRLSLGGWIRYTLGLDGA